MTNFNIGEKRGKVVLHTGPMNGGKSSALVIDVSQIEYSKHTYLIFKPDKDKRSINKISAMDGRLEYPAITIRADYPEDILWKVQEYDKRGRIDAIVVDEISLINPKIAMVVKKLIDKKRVVFLAGLDSNYRGEPFVSTALIKAMPYTEIHSHYPSCSIIKDGVRCSKRAIYTARLIKTENPEDVVRFEKKKGEVVDGYKRDFYYSPTIVIEGAENYAYTAVCPECFSVPGEKKTKAIIRFIINKNRVYMDELKRNFSDTNLEKILDFLVNERRVVLKDEVYSPQLYVEDSSLAMNYIRV